MDKLPKLRFERNNLHEQVKRLETFFQKLDIANLTVLNISQLEYRLNKVESSSYEEFNKLQNEIEFILDNNEGANLQSIADEKKFRVEFEDFYFTLITNVKDVISNFYNKCKNADDVEVVSLRSTGSGDLSYQVKLPIIKLPTFNGAFEQWLEFRDSFTALVDENNSIGNIQKFYYLKSSVDGEAAILLQSLEVSADNYAIAWDLLKERFENKRLLVHNYIKALFDASTLTKESHTELRKLSDTFTKNLRALQTLGLPTDKWDALIIHIITNKFDNVTRRDWESVKIVGDLPTIEDMNIFLKHKCSILEKLEFNKNTSKNEFVKPKGKFYSSSHMSTMSESKMSCYYCKADHAIYYCKEFIKLNVQSRIKEASRLKLCHNCLNPGHFAQQCKKSQCRVCKKRHNSLLHLKEVGKSEDTAAQEGTTRVEGDPPVASTAATIVGHTLNQKMNISQVLLSTAVVNVKDGAGKTHSARVLLDQGSHSHFITEALCTKLGLERNPIECAITGVGEVTSEVKYETTLRINSRVNNFNVNISCLVLPRITQNLPINSFDKNILELPKNLQLADPQFNVSREVDILIGVNVFYKVLCMKQIQKINQPTLQKTKLGWVIGGGLYCAPNQSKIMSCHVTLNQLNENLNKFWEIENCERSEVVDNADHFCESHFKKTFTRDDTGRFVVSIPFKENLCNLGNSRDQAINRFYYLESRFERNPKFKKEYCEFMSEYLRLGHMTKLNSDVTCNNELAYYLPHHAVIKDSSTTTRMRTVFDASARTDSGLSLNDVQYSGPTIQSDLVSILLRFREHAYVISADISKMYRMVLIQPDQRRFQRIFWRNDSSQELDCFELNTITYGTSSAPFLSVRCLFQLGLDNFETYPKASQIIMRDFYIDDLLSGSDSAEELLKIQNDITTILASGGFELRKWLSNKGELIDKFVTNKNLDCNILRLGEQERNKTLGIYWNANSDTINYSMQYDKFPSCLTKRHILSVIAQIFDPLGLLGPIVIVAKVILQLLWKENIDWDAAVPDHISKRWNNFRRDLPLLNQLNIPRYVVSKQASEFELHAFADESQNAYGACIYIRSKLQDGTYSTRLLCAKSRVAPLKVISIPRLELCGALLLAHLVDKVRQSINITFSRNFYWTDSQIVLCWLRGPPSKWKTFVANRVSIIQQITNPEHWHHVSSSDNSADLISRGMTCDQLMISEMWWNGPSFLQRDSSTWNMSNDICDSILVPEQGVISNVAVHDFKDFKLFSKFSSFTRLQRITAYCYRFISNLRARKQDRVLGPLTITELEYALDNLIRIAQVQSFNQDYIALKNKKLLKNTSNILSLNPFMDEDHIIRVGGRIQKANIPCEKMHPILLHNKHPFTRLLIIHEHHRLLHCGLQQLLYAIREQYWPIAGRGLVRNIVRKCIVCFKTNPAPMQYIMGNLPKTRVNEFTPFTNTGIDFAGPLMMKDRRTRGAKLVKVYICLFVCLSTRAVHLELVSDLTTDAFIATLRRFVARRGKPSNLYSDNGKTFVGANSVLTKLVNSNSFAEAIANEKIIWHFIPPRAPNFGGLWEAGVKGVKRHLKRILGNSHLCYEDFNTILCQIEGILNSRPISPQSSHPDDLLPLTPGHFLIGRSIMSIPEPNLLDVQEKYLRKYQRLQQLVQHFWQRWRREYLSELQLRVKWRQQASELIKVNDLVLIRDEHLPPGQWRLGRIVELHPGSDGVVRVVTIKCADSVCKRPLSKVSKLPIYDES